MAAICEGMANSSEEADFSVEMPREDRLPRINNYGSVIAESELEDQPEDAGQAEPNRCYCNCNSACKTKRKTGSNRGCPCRTANLSCMEGRCKCGTARKPCANMNPRTVARGSLPQSSMERQRRDIENAREEIEAFVDDLEDEQRRRLLVLIINNGRGSLDFARRLLTDDPDDPQPGPQNNGMPRWCICRNCMQMPTPDENKCCQRRECITSYELFSNLCIDRHVLELAIRARCDIRVEPLDFSMASFRKAAYRQFVLWEHGYLGKGNRRIIPACAVTKIRHQYPAPDNVYMGFRAE